MFEYANRYSMHYHKCSNFVQPILALALLVSFGCSKSEDSPIIEVSIPQSAKEKPVTSDNITSPAAIDIDNAADLQKTVEMCKENTVIRLNPGVYTLEKPLQITKRINITGTGQEANEVIIERAGGNTLVIDSPTCEIKHVLIRSSNESKENTDWKDRITVRILQGEANFIGCEFRSDKGYCVYVTGEKTAPIFHECLFSEGLSGLMFEESSCGTIDDCEIRNLKGAGVGATGNSLVHVKKCVIYGCSYGILCCDEGKGPGKAVVDDCEIYGMTSSEKAEQIAFGIGVQGGDVICTNSKIYHCEMGIGLCRIENRNSGTFENCDIYENKDKNVHIVNGSSTFKNCRIYDTLERMEKKEYDGFSPEYGNNISISILHNSAVVFEDCTLSHHNNIAYIGDETGEPVNYYFKNCKFLNGKELVVTNLNTVGTFDHCEFAYYSYIGIILLSLHPDTVIKDCAFHHAGTGVLFQESENAEGGVRGTVENSEFNNLTETGIIVSRNANAIISNCNIHHCESGGLGFAVQSSGTVVGNRITDNRRCGIIIGTDKYCMFSKNVLHNNVPRNWGIISDNPQIMRIDNEPNE